MISSQIKECIKVPERLLKLSRTAEQTTSSFNIAANITDTLSLLDYEIKRQGIALVKSFSNTKETLYGNETDFKMIILNLVQNAINAMPEGGTLEVKTNTNKDKIIVEIKDTGIGIPESSHAAIFRRFYREAAVHRIPGIGIGLYLTREIITLQGGYLMVASAPGKGSTFSVFLPRHF